jgi:Flp pilus assembly protein TadB
MLLFVLTNYLIYIAAAAITCYGMWLIVGNSIRSLSEKIALDRRIKQRNRERKNKTLGIETKPSLLVRWANDLDKMLQHTKPNYKKETAVQSFIIFHGALFGITAILIGLISKSYVFGSFIGIAFVIGNFFRHRLKLRQIRLEGGYKLADLTGLLATKYSSEVNPKMRIVLSNVNNEIEDPIFKRHITHIVRVDQNYVSDEQLREVIDRFVYSINTSFARELGATIFKALKTQEHVGDTLTRIDLKIQQNIKDINEEIGSKVDIKYLSWFHIFAFPATFLAVMFFVKISETSLLQFQFETSSGRFMFAFSVASIGVARLVSAWFTRQPNDY